MSQCKSHCDCQYDPDPERGGHEADCHSRVECDENGMCDRHAEEAQAEYSWMRGLSRGAVTGVMSESEKQDMRDAGRGHLVLP